MQHILRPPKGRKPKRLRGNCKETKGPRRGNDDKKAGSPEGVAPLGPKGPKKLLAQRLKAPLRAKSFVQHLMPEERRPFGAEGPLCAIYAPLPGPEGNCFQTVMSEGRLASPKGSARKNSEGASLSPRRGESSPLGIYCGPKALWPFRHILRPEGPLALWAT